MDDESIFYCYKVVLLGDSGTGKTCLLSRFTDDTYNPKLASTIGVDFRLKNLEVDGKNMKLQFWDTAGQERFRAVVTSYHRSVNGVILVYDITSRNSFNSVATWKRVVEDYNPNEDFSIVIIGNKCEMNDKRQVSEEEGRTLAEDHGALFYETSAKDDVNVKDAFNAIARLIRENRIGRRSSPKSQALVSTDQIHLDPEKNKKSTCRC